MSDELDFPQPAYRAVRREAGMDPGTKRLAMIAGGIGVALVALVGAWAMMDRGPAAVPVIQADSSPVRVKPANPGGMQVTGANEEALSEPSHPGTVNVAPPPEQPELKALHAMETAKPKPPTPQPFATPQKVASQVATPPVARPAVPAAPPAPQPPAVIAAAHPTVAPPLPPVAARPGSVGRAQVQLAALQSEQAALAAWQHLAKRMPDLLASRRPDVERAEHDGRTIYRLRTGGFADIAAATQFCERVRSKGADCSIASF